MTRAKATTPLRRLAKVAAVAALLAGFGGAHAGPADYVFTPHVTAGEREIEVKYGTARKADGTVATSENAGFGYGVTGNWFTEIYAHHSLRGGGSNSHEWENKFMLTEPGEYTLDVGAVAELEVPQANGDPYEATLGVLLQKNVDRLQFNLNGLLVREFHDGQPHGTKHGYQWQAKYRWRPSLMFGAQGFGNLERWPLGAQAGAHNSVAGPAVFGRVRVGDRSVIKYNAGFLFGATESAARHTFRAQIEYEF